MTWAEVSDDFSTWTIPASRAKNGTTHIVPTSEPARELLRSLPQINELVFPGLRGPFNGWSKAKAALDAKSGVTDWRLHDLRRTVATGLQRLGVRLEVTEQVLNHVSGSRAGIVGVYQRHDFASEKRAALEAWGSHVEAIVEGRTPESNVLKSDFEAWLRSRRRAAPGDAASSAEARCPMGLRNENPPLGSPPVRSTSERPPQGAAPGKRGRPAGAKPISATLDRVEVAEAKREAV